MRITKHDEDGRVIMSTDYNKHKDSGAANSQKQKNQSMESCKEEKWVSYLPELDTDHSKQGCNKEETEHEKKNVPNYDPNQWKKSKKKDNKYTADSWKQYVPNCDPDQWKKNLAALGSAGGNYNPVGSFKITLPAVNNFNLFKMADITAPGGVTIGIKMPFPMNESILNKMGDYIRSAGGEIELGNTVK